MRKRGVRVVSGLTDVWPPWSTAGQPAGAVVLLVAYGRRAGRAPRVVAVNVVLGADGGVAVEGARVGWQRVLLAQAAEGRLPAARFVVALRAADEAALEKQMPEAHAF